MRVVDPQATLLWRVHEEQPAEGPEGLATEALLAFLIEQKHRLPRVGRLGGGDQAGEASANDDEIGGHVTQFNTCKGLAHAPEERGAYVLAKSPSIYNLEPVRKPV